MSDIIVLIPAYEPSEILITIVKKFKEVNFKTVVVNDGSGNEFYSTFSEVSKYAIVLNHSENMGKGHALRTGLIYIKKNFGNCTILTADADGQHSISDSIIVALSAQEHTDGVTLGSRSFDKNVPLRSRFGNTATRLVYKLFTGTYLRDTQTGLRAFSSSLIDFMVNVNGERYEYEMNVLLELSRSNIPIYEKTIETIYYDDNSQSHFDTIKDSIRVYGNILKFAASSFIGFVVDYSLYSLLVIITSPFGDFGIPFSNIAARIVSASVNFSINKHMVFKNNGSILKTGTQYFLLASCILLFNTILLSFLVEKAGINKFTAKIFTEITFFIFSWLIQRYFIFKKASKTCISRR